MQINTLDYTGILLNFNEKHIRVITDTLVEIHDGRKFDIPKSDTPFDGQSGAILYAEVHVVGNTYAISVNVGGVHAFINHGPVHKEVPENPSDIDKLAELIKPKDTRMKPQCEVDMSVESFESMSRFKRDALYATLVFQGLIPDKIEEAGFEFIYIYNVALECWIGLAFKDMPEDQGKSILSTIATADHLQATLAAYEAHGTVCFTGDDMINVIEMTVLKAYLTTENQDV